MKIHQRGDVFLVNLNPVIGSEQGKIRPAVIIQNDIYNTHSDVVIIATISSRQYRGYLSDVHLPKGTIKCLKKDSIVVGNQIRSVDKIRLIKHLGTLPKNIIPSLNQALKISLDLDT